MADTCAACDKSASVTDLKRCAKCRTTFYCSRDCQKTDWKSHKKICAQQAGDRFTQPNARANVPRASSQSTALEKHIDNPFTRLDNGTYLVDRPDRDVYKLLIDAVRMRQNDDYTMEGKVDSNSLYSDHPASSAIEPFRKFMRLAESRTKVLPPGWSADKQKECEEFGLNGDNFSNLKKPVEKADIQDHYGDPRMPMQLRMLAEEVYGRGPGGQDGSFMRTMMMSAESGSGGPHMSMLSL